MTTSQGDVLGTGRKTVGVWSAADIVKALERLAESGPLRIVNAAGFVVADLAPGVGQLNGRVRPEPFEPGVGGMHPMTAWPRLLEALIHAEAGVDPGVDDRSPLSMVLRPADLTVAGPDALTLAAVRSLIRRPLAQPEMDVAVLRAQLDEANLALETASAPTEDEALVIEALIEALTGWPIDRSRVSTFDNHLGNRIVTALAQRIPPDRLRAVVASGRLRGSAQLDDDEVNELRGTVRTLVQSRDSAQQRAHELTGQVELLTLANESLVAERDHSQVVRDRLSAQVARLIDDQGLGDEPDTVGAQAVRLLTDERREQIVSKDYTPDHDDLHTDGSIARAAAAYAVGAYPGDEPLGEDLWPWELDSYKPTNPLRDLVKSGALILAEIERRLRSAQCTTPHVGVGEYRDNLPCEVPAHDGAHHGVHRQGRLWWQNADDPDAEPCTCTQVRAATHLEPAEWQQDPDCPVHPMGTPVGAAEQIADRTPLASAPHPSFTPAGTYDPAHTPLALFRQVGVALRAVPATLNDEWVHVRIDHGVGPDEGARLRVAELRQLVTDQAPVWLTGSSHDDLAAAKDKFPGGGKPIELAEDEDGDSVRDAAMGEGPFVVGVYDGNGSWVQLGGPFDTMGECDTFAAVQRTQPGFEGDLFTLGADQVPDTAPADGPDVPPMTDERAPSELYRHVAQLADGLAARRMGIGQVVEWFNLYGAELLAFVEFDPWSMVGHEARSEGAPDHWDIGAVIDVNRKPTLGGTIEPTGYWMVDDLGECAHPLTSENIDRRPALRDPAGGCWAHWLDLPQLASLRDQLDVGALAMQRDSYGELDELRDRVGHLESERDELAQQVEHYQGALGPDPDIDSLVVEAADMNEADLAKAVRDGSPWAEAEAARRWARLPMVEALTTREALEAHILAMHNLGTRYRGEPIDVLIDLHDSLHDRPVPVKHAHANPAVNVVTDTVPMAMAARVVCATWHTGDDDTMDDGDMGAAITQLERALRRTEGGHPEPEPWGELPGIVMHTTEGEPGPHSFDPAHPERGWQPSVPIPFYEHHTGPVANWALNKAADGIEAITKGINWLADRLGR